MVRVVSADVAATSIPVGRDSLSAEVSAAMSRIPRHCFVPPESRDLAYENQPLQIGYGQTISQPFIVALMSDLASVRPGDKVLEIGTGCGYQTAILAELGAEVFSIERIPQLAEAALDRLDRLGFGGTIRIRSGDGTTGWPEHAPYNIIVVAAETNAAVVQELLKQLAPGGRMVVPEKREAGARDAGSWGGNVEADDGGAPRISNLGYRLSGGPETDLCLIVKDENGECVKTPVLPVAFVPLVEGQATV
jgi:protein-L-isoaspartate(D-aspartate) O-methyltransferase